MIEIIPSYNFMVSIGSTQLGFQKVSGMARSCEVMSYAEGGMPDIVHVFPKHASESGKLRMEAGVVLSDSFPFCRVGTAIETLRIDVLNMERKSTCAFIFKNLVITRWELSDLDAMQSNHLMQIVELAYGEMYVAA